MQTGDGVRVELLNGDTIAARTALITLPMNVLNSVEFEPGLSEIKRAAATERHAGSGMKCYVHVKGDIGNVSVLAPESEAINWAMTYDHGPDGSWLIVFGTDPKRLPLDDVAGMQAALRRLLPGVEVESIFGWDWAADPYALGPGASSGRVSFPGCCRSSAASEGRLFFASGGFGGRMAQFYRRRNRKRLSRRARDRSLSDEVNAFPRHVEFSRHQNCEPEQGTTQHNSRSAEPLGGMGALA